MIGWRPSRPPPRPRPRPAPKPPARSPSTRSWSAAGTTGSPQPPIWREPDSEWRSAGGRGEVGGRAGLRVAVVERRGIVGGAWVTEEVWPGARVWRASYVVSMLQAKVVSDLRLEDFGYRAIPLAPAYAALTPDGPIFFHNEPAR